MMLLWSYEKLVRFHVAKIVGNYLHSGFELTLIQLLDLSDTLHRGVVDVVSFLGAVFGWRKAAKLKIILRWSSLASRVDERTAFTTL